MSRIEAAIIVAIVAIIAAVAIPGLWRARMAKNETAAIGTLRLILSAEIAYASICGDNRYATALSTLGVPPRGSMQGFLPPELAVDVPERDGFRFSLTKGDGAIAEGKDCNGTVTHTAYFATAVPIAYGRTGQRAFAVNTAGTIWQNAAASPPHEPFGAPATPIQ